MQLRNPLRFNCSLLCVLLLTLSNYCQANDILGCGGFVKSPVNIDYSKVSIKLYTASGSLKESTDCAPNNGYYFLPVEGKGDHVLRVEPPEGWIFEPNEVTIKIDGQSDPCSRGEDVNFIFKGFSISGKVLSNGLLSGPSGVTVSLKDKKTNQLIKSLVTGVHGDYSFEEVLPGSYEVSASHPKWQFKGKNSLLVKVHEENVVLNPEIISEAITIQGFDVSGAVEGDGEAIKGVQFGLFSRIKGLNPKDIGNCNEASIPYKNQPNNGLNYLCHAVSGADGTFSFKSLPPGDYKLVPFYKGSSIQFDVKPAEVDFVVKHDSVNLQPTFQVEGFGISGRILGRVNGQGVANAEVLLTSKTTGPKKTRTDGNGVYYIDNVRAGTYTLEVNSENRKFEPLTIKISPSSSKVPDVHVAAFRVCGKVNFVSPSLGNRVRFDSNHGPDILTDIGSDGSFCTFLKSGTYKITPEGRADDLMTFKPASVDVKLAESPILDVKFDQFAAKISGKVSLIGNEFEKLTIRLSRENGGQESTWTATQGQNWNTFEFSHVVNGKYKLTISKDHASSADWCWENDQLDVVVNGADVTGLTFKQKGFVGIFQTSHLVNLKLRSPSGRSEELKVNRLHKHCLPEAGVYTVEPVSCHKFKLETEDATPEVFMLDTNSKSELKLSAAKHKLDIVVNSKENVTDLVLVISLESSNGKVSQKTINLVQNRDGAAADNYRASLYVEPETDVHVTATSSSLLLKPPNHSVRIQNECPRELLFTGKAGLFVRGSVRPALEGVEITIKQTNAEGDVLTISSSTDGQGNYLAGPFDVASDDGRELEISAEKDGYIMDKAWTDGALDKLGQFLAKKLAGVSVKVLGEDKKPLRDVLISLSGGSDNYRRNLVTPASGGLTFVGLSPGHYYLKSMMKEYAFEPSSKMIEVREGQTEDVDIVGKRTAFSVFGSIASLSGEPEAGAVIEAIPDRLDGQGDCSKLHAEEAVADEQGSFRIRGLKPKCFYYVRIKTNDDRNVVISRTVPAEEKVQVTDDDVRNVQLIAFRKATHMDITGDVLTSHYEHLNSVKINLYILGTEQLVSSNQLSSVSAFFTMPSIPLDSSRTYVLRLETTLARTLYDFTVQEISFQANKSYDHFQFEFYPKLKMGTGSSLGDSSIEADGTYGGNVYTLPLFLLIGLIFYNWAQLQPYVQTAYESAQSLVARSQSGQGSRGSSPETELRNKKNKVKRT